MSHADDTTLPCAECGGDQVTGHQRLCKTLYTGPKVDIDDVIISLSDDDAVLDILPPYPVADTAERFMPLGQTSEPVRERLKREADPAPSGPDATHVHTRYVTEPVAPKRRPRVPTIRQNKYTVTFYSELAQPVGFPPFSYVVSGSVLGRTQYQAFVKAPTPDDARYVISDYFNVADFEIVRSGFVGIAEAPLRGTVVTEESQSIWARVARLVFGDA